MKKILKKITHIKNNLDTEIILKIAKVVFIIGLITFAYVVFSFMLIEVSKKKDHEKSFNDSKIRYQTQLELKQEEIDKLRKEEVVLEDYLYDELQECVLSMDNKNVRNDFIKYMPQISYHNKNRRVSYLIIKNMVIQNDEEFSHYQSISTLVDSIEDTIDDEKSNVKEYNDLLYEYKEFLNENLDTIDISDSENYDSIKTYIQEYEKFQKE